MKRTFFALMMLCIVLAVTGCGRGDDSRPLITQEIISHPSTDIMQDLLTNELTFSQGFATVLAGLHPTREEEFRAFITFPLADIPQDAIIQSATLDIVIKSVTVLPPSSSIPMVIELIDLPPTALANALFFSPPLGTTSINPPIASADVNLSVPVNVTSLMRVAQARGHSKFQIRILQDFGPFPPGLIEIDDDLDPPLLFLTYF